MNTTGTRFTVKLREPIRNVRIVSGGLRTPKSTQHNSTRSQSAEPAASPVALDQQHVDQLFDQLHERLQELEISRKDSLAVIHQMTVELSVAIAGKVLFHEIQEEQFPIREMIDEMLGHADMSDAVTVYLNPMDLKLLPKDDADQRSRHGINISWVASPELSRGSARMDSSRFSLFYDGALQLGEIRQNLLEMLNDSEIERRTNGSSSSDLRRFPERRASG